MAEQKKPHLPIGYWIIGSAIDELVQRGLVEAEDPSTGNLRLTDQGEALHATALTTQKQVRQQAVQGITEADDYRPSPATNRLKSYR